MSIEARGETTSKARRGVPEGGFLGRLRGTAVIAVLVGAGGSVGLMLYAGRRQDSRILLLLFGIWVLSPFVDHREPNVRKKFFRVGSWISPTILVRLCLHQLFFYNHSYAGRCGISAGT